MPWEQMTGNTIKAIKETQKRGVLEKLLQIFY